MSKPIVPDSGPSGKSDPAQKKIKNKSRVLSGFIEDTERKRKTAFDRFREWH